MPDAKSSLKVQPVKATAGVVQPRRLAVGIELAKLQYLAQIQGDEQAPHFVQGQEPTQDGRGYRATDGQHYYRPLLRVAQRSVAPLGPVVRFLRDADANVFLQFELEEAPPTGMPDGAEPFNVRVSQVLLQWLDGGQARQRLIDQPTLTAEDQPDPTKPNFFIAVAVKLAPEEVEPLYQALSRPDAQAKVVVTLTFGYWLDQRPPTVPPPGTRVGPIRIIRRPGVLGTTMRRPAVIADGTLTGAVAQPTTTTRVAISRVGTLNAASLANMALRRTVLEQAKEREKKPDFRSVTLTRTLPFSFDPALEQNRPIYGAITGDGTLGESWTDTDFGPIRRASFPNTVYRLPDEIRLAYNPELGTPHVVPTLYRDEQEEVRVRVTLRAAPWHDPAKLVRLRDYLLRTSAGALAAPEVVVGGYQQAKLKLTSAFPEHMRALFGDDVSVSLEGGFDITLDLSLEFYRFLSQLLVGPVGLTGEVTVSLDTMPTAEGATPGAPTRRVPMRLSLDDVASLPVAVQLEPEALSPRQVQLVNQARAEMRIGDCVTRLLQYDANSVVPIEVFEAISTAPTFPTTLAADGVVTIEFAPKEESSDSLWNAVLVELIGQDLVLPAEQILDRIHEVAPTGALSWQLAVECPVFMQDPIPEQFRNLYRVEVQILRAGFAQQQVVLGKDQAASRVTMQRTLREIIGDVADSVGTFNYRVRNVYFDHQGQWGEERSGEGTSIFVFPNPVAND